jgi:beta-lactamase regulating signal transducer with metallopeptidase domain
MTDVLLALLRINLAAGVAVGLILLLRRPVRRLFGAQIAYGLWALIPLAAGAMLLPARVVKMTESAALPAARHAAPVAPHLLPALTQAVAPVVDLPTILGLIWLAGAVAALAWLIWRQAQFARAVRAGRAGPAVVGVLRPRIVAPHDFADRYTPREQQVVLAHEQTHIARQDPRINAAVALARCANWFNPLIHLLVHYLRIDQELACDAQVVAAYPAARRSYAEAMLKTQLAARPLPLGCYWPAQSAHPLAERIGLLTRAAPGRWARATGAGFVGALALGSGWAAWAARPAEIVFATASAAPAPQRLAAAVPLVRPRLTFGPETHTPASDPTALDLSLIHTVSTTPEPEAQAAQPAAAATPAAPEPPEGCGGDEPPTRVEPRRLPPGFFGPSHRFHTAANWSSVEPGSAVRVVAKMTDPEGVRLTTDLTAFGSQSWYRLGCVRNIASRYKLFTSVTQHGERLTVTAALDRSFRAMVSGSIELASGETGTITLPNGLKVTVTPFLRPETPQESAEGGRGLISVLRIPSDA